MRKVEKDGKAWVTYTNGVVAGNKPVTEKLRSGVVAACPAKDDPDGRPEADVECTTSGTGLAGDAVDNDKCMSLCKEDSTSC